VKKSDLKELIKPLVKECIHEVLLEEGLLSNVVSEVAKGLSTPPIIAEQAKKPVRPAVRTEQPKRRDYKQNRKKLMDAIGGDAYNGVDLFEGTTPTPAQQETSAGSVDMGEPTDAGVDIGSILGQSSRIWESMNKGKQ
tara:strand:+ start:250 stop:663 length:414 start_codon:yes stop_codon:yes gene_type:complete